MGSLGIKFVYEMSFALDGYSCDSVIPILNSEVGEKLSIQVVTAGSNDIHTDGNVLSFVDKVLLQEHEKLSHM